MAHSIVKLPRFPFHSDLRWATEMLYPATATDLIGPNSGDEPDLSQFAGRIAALVCSAGIP